MKLKLLRALISGKLKSILDRQLALTLFFGLIIAVVNLVITLNVIATMVIIILVIALAIFEKSFSRGWLFLLGACLLFPAIKIGENIFLADLFMLILVVVSLAQFAFESSHFFIDKISYSFFLFLLTGVCFIVFSFIFNGSVQEQIWSIFISFLLIWMLLFVFQYFFQTKKRIIRFLILIAVTGVMHAFYGIIMFLGNWQSATGTGIIFSISNQPLFNGARKQISGFLGVGTEALIGHNFLASLLAVSFLSTLGLILYHFKKNPNVISENKKIIEKKTIVFFLFLIIQFIGIILTFSYASLISASIGTLIIGIMLRNNKIIIPAIALIIALTVFIPRFSSSFDSSAFGNFENLNKIVKHWIMGNGVIFSKDKTAVISGNIFNSYLFIWNYYGVLGLLILLSMFYKFFIDIYQSYKKAQGQERLLLTVITGIFIAFILEGFSGNILIFGPTAIVFWLFYAVVLNLKNNLIPISFILNSGLFSNTSGFFIGGRIKNLDGIRKRIRIGNI